MIGQFVLSRITASLKTGKVSELIAEIEWLLSNCDESRPNVLGNIIYSLALKDNLIKLIDILTLDSEIGNICDRSYQHDNGFKKIVLLEGESFKLRLHVWEPAYKVRSEDNDLHDHRWDFASLMMKGSFVSVLYQESENGIEERYPYTYLPVAGGDSYGLEKVSDSKVKLYESCRILIKQGMGYFMPCQTVHKVEYESEEKTVTMVITDKPINNNCRMYSVDERSQVEEVIINRLDARDIRNNLESLKYL